MTFVRVTMLASLCAIVSVAWQDNDPDRNVKGGSLPAGWAVRPDRGGPEGIKFNIAGNVYHFMMGSAGTFYKSDWTKTGDFKFSARLTQKAAPSHPISYGLMIGGTDMGGANQTYSYFLVRNLGEFYIANKEGSGRPITVVGWTGNQAIVKQADDGHQTNTLAVQVQGDSVIFLVNDKEVNRLPKGKLHTEGMYGFRIGHNLDVDVDQVMTPR